MISLTNIHKTYGKVPVLKGLDLSIENHGIFAILGPNGSGKTTLIKSVLGMVIPDQGDIKIDDQSIIGDWDYRNEISYLPQIANFPSHLTIRELLGMIRNMRQKYSSDQNLLDLFGLQDYMDQRLGNLSGGTRQKVNLVMAFMFDSPLLILDEPTTGLDPLAMVHLRELIQLEKKKGKTILITTHIMDFVEDVADKVVFLLDGKIYFHGSIDELKRQTNEQNVEHAIAHILSDNNV